MLLKKPEQRKIKNQKLDQSTFSDAEKLACELADKPYGKNKQNTGDFVTTSISIPKELLEIIEDITIKNKRNGLEPKNVSALIRKAIEIYLN